MGQTQRNSQEAQPSCDRVIHSGKLVISRRLLLKSTAVALGAPMISRGRFALFAQNEATYSVRAVDLIRRSTVIDMLGLLTLDYRKMSVWQAQPDRFQPADFQRLKDAGITVFHPAVGYIVGDIYAE